MKKLMALSAGVLGSDKKYSDTGAGDVGTVRLTKEWQEYTIDLAGKDLTRIKTGFVCTLAGQGSSVICYASPPNPCIETFLSHL